MKHLLLATLPLLTACTRPMIPLVGINVASYTLNSQRILVDASATTRPTQSSSPSEITIQLGTRPVTKHNGIFLLNYKKPAQPSGSYQLARISYSFELAADSTTTYGVEYDEGITGTLTQLNGGGYSGTFAGKNADTHERSTVKGTFNNVFTSK